MSKHLKLTLRYCRLQYAKVRLTLQEQCRADAGDTGAHQDGFCVADPETVPANAEFRLSPQQRLPYHEALLL